MSRRDGLRDRWKAEVYRNRTIGEACRVLLIRLSETMTERGAVSVPQERLARELNIDVRRVKDRIREAKEKGFLQKTGGGYRGRTAGYAATMPTRMSAAPQHPSLAEGACERHPIIRTQYAGDQVLMGTSQPSPNARAFKDEARQLYDTTRQSGGSGADQNKERSDEEVAAGACLTVGAPADSLTIRSSPSYRYGEPLR